MTTNTEIAKKLDTLIALMTAQMTANTIPVAAIPDAGTPTAIVPPVPVAPPAPNFKARPKTATVPNDKLHITKLEQVGTYTYIVLNGKPTDEVRAILRDNYGGKFRTMTEERMERVSKYGKPKLIAIGDNVWMWGYPLDIRSILAPMCPLCAK